MKINNSIAAAFAILAAAVLFNCPAGDDHPDVGRRAVITFDTGDINPITGAVTSAVIPRSSVIHVATGDVLERLPTPFWIENNIPQPFNGWFTDPDSEFGYPVEVPYTVTGDATLYAYWGSEEVVFNATGETAGQFPGATVLGYPSMSKYVRRPPWNIPNIPYAEQGANAFLGWHYRAGSAGNPERELTLGTNITDIRLVAGIRTVYAKFGSGSSTFTVTFKINSGTWPEGGKADKIAAVTNPGQMTVNGAGEYPNVPVLPGFNFSGWFDDNGVPFNGDSFVTKNTVVSARWNLKPGIDSISYQVEGNNFVGTFSNGEKINAELIGDYTIETVNGNQVVLLDPGAYINLAPGTAPLLNQTLWTLDAYVYVPNSPANSHVFAFAQEDAVNTGYGVVYVNSADSNFVARPNGSSASGQVAVDGVVRQLPGSWHLLSYVKFSNGWIDAYHNGGYYQNRQAFNLLNENDRLNPLNHGWLGRHAWTHETMPGAMYYKFSIRTLTFAQGTYPNRAEAEAKVAQLNGE